MSQTNTQNRTTEVSRAPDFIAKSPKQVGRKERLERVGAGWTRDDGGICIRLYGTQIVSEAIYLYPMEDDQAKAE